jgi:type VII secretion protein EccE
MQLSPAVPGNRGDTTRRTWITIQAIRTADIYQDADLNAVLANAVRRLIRRLTRDDLPSRALDRDEALSLIAALSQVGDTAEDPPTARETWGAWQTGSTAQACFRIDRWQEASENDRQLALRRLQMVPSRGTTVAIAAQRGDRRVEQPTRMVIRITEATHTRLNNSADLLRFAMRDVAPSIRVERLNGDHLAAVAASLPLGGRAAAR